MNCPRCQLTLKPVRYESVEADVCDACWGFWLDTGELESVLLDREMSFSKEETAAILDLHEASSKGPTAPAACPRCRKTMKRVHYDALIHLVIDRCEDHGVWLDSGEIKKVEALAARSAEFHRVLLRKLGILGAV